MAVSVRLSPEQRLAAWKRYSAKKWYERVVLQPRVELDLPQLEYEDALEVQQLRFLLGNTPPWKNNATT